MAKDTDARKPLGAGRQRPRRASVRPDPNADPVAAACTYAAHELAARANPSQAAAMQAYMKTDMPFYGVKKPDRVSILRELVRRFPPDDHAGYVRLVTGLWQQDHREERYLAIGVARAHPEHVVPASLPLYRQLIVAGAWWDFVDEIATQLIRALVLEHADAVWPTIDSWIDDQDLWLRRTAILLVSLRPASRAPTKRSSSSARRSVGRYVTTREPILTR